ncbi:MAG: hypothetical protein F7B19_06865 [Desulfurococcales archaeon]|nr:hypothetical protein [Desulfurococcales archaeon]
MRETISRLTRRFRHVQMTDVSGPSPIIGELAAMGVIDAAVNASNPGHVDLAEMVKAKIYARHGHLAYVNTFK